MYNELWSESTSAGLYLQCENEFTDASMMLVYDAWRGISAYFCGFECMQSYRSEKVNENVCNGRHCMIYVRLACMK